MQFFFNPEDIGKNRAEACCSQIAELNTYVPISVHTQKLNEEFVQQFQVHFFSYKTPRD